jgi:hypothetical protein
MSKFVEEKNKYKDPFKQKEIVQKTEKENDKKTQKKKSKIIKDKKNNFSRKY